MSTGARGHQSIAYSIYYAVALSATLGVWNEFTALSKIIVFDIDILKKGSIK